MTDKGERGQIGEAKEESKEMLSAKTKQESMPVGMTNHDIYVL